MILIYILVGFITSVVGALPLGATNIAVINTTLKQDKFQAYKIVLGAGVAEVLLSYYALHYKMTVTTFFDTNQWLQVLIAFVLLIIGGYLFFSKSTNKTKAKSNRIRSKYTSGFLLGLLNPPVLIYWLLIYGVINTYRIALSATSSLVVLVLFFLGVYLGKITTLYFYSKFSLLAQQRFKNSNGLINKITGSLLFFVGIFNVFKLYFV